jgi:NAD dependent epimerase/dehydratase family enzyme
VSWISLRDEVRAIIHALTSDLDGPVNLTSPNPVTNRELTETLGSVLHRPTLIPVPAFAPKLLLGPDMAGPLLFDSKRVVPAKLLGDDFAFEHADLADGLRAALGIDP